MSSVESWNLAETSEVFLIMHNLTSEIDFL